MRELDADGAGTDDHRALRGAADGERFAAGDYGRAIDRDVRERAGGSSSRDDDVGGAIRRFAADHRIAVFQRGRPGDYLHAIFGEQSLDTFDELFGNLAAAIDGRAEVELGVGDGDAPLACITDEIDDVCVLEDRFAGDATPVEAEPADAITFEERNGESKLGCANGGHVTARATANDCNVEVSHSLLLDYHRLSVIAGRLGNLLGAAQLLPSCESSGANVYGWLLKVVVKAASGVVALGRKERPAEHVHDVTSE